MRISIELKEGSSDYIVTSVGEKNSDIELVIGGGGFAVGDTLRIDTGELTPKAKPFWFSVRSVKDCNFSRSNGYVGNIFFGYSVCIRVFGFNLTRF